MRSHSLELEIGAWVGSPKEERICNVCKEGNVDEARFFSHTCAMVKGLGHDG